MSNPVLLFAEARPTTQGELNTSGELDKIQDAYGLNVKICAHTTVTKLRDDLKLYKPAILHISAHGNPFGEIIFEDGAGDENSVSKNALASFLKSYTDYLRLVVLNACDSDQIAKEIANVTGLTVIGFAEQINDTQAIDWASEFYGEWEKDKEYRAFLKTKTTWKSNKNQGIPRFYFRDFYEWKKRSWIKFFEQVDSASDLGNVLNALKVELDISKDDYLDVLYEKLRAKDLFYSFRDKFDSDLFLLEKYPNFEDELVRPVSIESADYQEITLVDSKMIKQSFGGFFKRLWLTLTGKYSVSNRYERALELLGVFDRSEVALMMDTFEQFIVLTYSDTGGKSPQKNSFDDDLMPKLKDEKEDKFYLLLGGSGTGKSTQMQLLFAKLAVEKSGYSVLYRSGVDDLRPVFELDNTAKANTILLLDSFDEAVDAYDDSELFFRKIETYTQKYAKVIIACRTQFFVNGIRSKTALLNIDNQRDYKIYDYKHIFLNYLDEKSIQQRIESEYLDDEKKQQALSIFRNSKNLMVRPIMLHYLKEILASAIEKKVYKLDSFMVYQIIVSQWLEREERTVKIDQLQQKLQNLMAILAIKSYAKFEKGISHAHLFSSREIQDVLGRSNLDKVLFVDRSLLKRAIFKQGGETHFTFAHRTFKEFFIASLLFDGRIDENELDKKSYRDAWQFYKEMCNHRYRDNMGDKDKIHFLKLSSMYESSSIKNFAMQVFIFNNGTISDGLFLNLEKILSLDCLEQKEWLISIAQKIKESGENLIDFQENKPENIQLADLQFLKYENDQYSFWHDAFVDFLYLYPLFDADMSSSGIDGFDFDKIKFPKLFDLEITYLKKVKGQDVQFFVDVYDFHSQWKGSGMDYLEFANSKSMLDANDFLEISQQLSRAERVFVKNIRISGSFLGFDVIWSNEKGTLMSKPGHRRKNTPIFLKEMKEEDISAPDMAIIPEGDFTMGDNSFTNAQEHPRHISSFKLAKKAVTVKDFANFVRKTKYVTTAEKAGFSTSSYREGNTLTSKVQVGCFWQFDELGRPMNTERSDYPVIYVSWFDAIGFCNFMSVESGLKPAYDEQGNFIDENGELTIDITKVKGYRLPSEAEWEYAAGHGFEHTYFSGTNNEDELKNFANFFGKKNAAGIVLEPVLEPVGKGQANRYGLYDMSGNVWEWCQDKWHDNYDGAPKDGQAWTSGSSSYRVIRGGSWRNYAHHCRVAFRSFDSADDHGSYIGFRLATSL